MNGLWDPNDTQYCDGCGLYHFKDECTDPYFNDPDNWAPHKPPVRHTSGASMKDQYMKRWES